MPATVPTTDDLALVSNTLASLQTQVTADTAATTALQAALEQVKARVQKLEGGTTTNPPPTNPPPTNPPPTDPPPTTPPPSGSPGSQAGVPEWMTLKPYTGSMSLKDGTVLDGYAIKGALVAGNNVTIKNCKLTGTGSWGVDADGKTGLKVLNCTFVGPGTTNSGILTGSNWEVSYCDISGWENGVMAQSGTCRFVGNYIHDLKAGPDGHYDCIQFEDGSSGGLIDSNRLIGKDTSCIFLQPRNGKIQNLTITNNILDGTSGWPLYVEMDKFGSSGVVVKNNKIKKGGWGGYVSIDQSASISEWSGNTDLSSGATIAKP
jgi:hypothetical protein